MQGQDEAQYRKPMDDLWKKNNPAEDKIGDLVFLDRSATLKNRSAGGDSLISALQERFPDHMINSQIYINPHIS
jgi:hypothetical protein